MVLTRNARKSCECSDAQTSGKTNFMVTGCERVKGRIGANRFKILFVSLLNAINGSDLEKEGEECLLHLLIFNGHTGLNLHVVFFSCFVPGWKRLLSLDSAEIKNRNTVTQQKRQFRYCKN